MIVVFVTATAEVFSAFPGADANFLALVTSTLSVGQDVFTLADDPNVLAAPNLYNVDNPVTPTATVLKNVIKLTPSSTPINLTDVVTITVQLYQPDGFTPLLLASVVVTLTAAPGLLSASSVTTDGGGTGTVSLSTVKGSGDIGISGASAGYLPGSTTVTVLVPTTAAQQNWLDRNDIRNDAVTEEKIAASVLNVNKVAQTNPSIMWTVKRAILEDLKDATLTDSVNSIVSDGIDHIYRKSVV